MSSVSVIIIVIICLLCHCAICQQEECQRLTLHDAEGPYYTSDAPIRSDMSLMDPKAERLFIAGQVIDIDSCEGISNAKIEFWNANSSGVYDNEGYNMRGGFYTNQNGYYAMNTRLPGYYHPRPHHIHVKIWINDIVVLTTQLYFENHPSGVRGGDETLQLTLVPARGNYGYHTSFTFVVDHTEDTINDVEPLEIGGQNIGINHQKNDHGALVINVNKGYDKSKVMLDAYLTVSLILLCIINLS